MTKGELVSRDGRLSYADLEIDFTQTYLPEDLAFRTQANFETLSNGDLESNSEIMVQFLELVRLTAWIDSIPKNCGIRVGFHLDESGMMLPIVVGMNESGLLN